MTLSRKLIFIYTLNLKRSERPLEKHFSMINIVDHTKLMSWILKKKKKIERYILGLWKYHSCLPLAIVTVYIKVIHKFLLILKKNICK